MTIFKLGENSKWIERFKDGRRNTFDHARSMQLCVGL
jgi:hypothetical protein